MTFFGVKVVFSFFFDGNIIGDASFRGTRRSRQTIKGRGNSKIQRLQAPFIANNGQVDERVRFYAKTFGGTVFVTKDGEIVYSLPEGASGRSRGAGEWGTGEAGQGML